MLTTVYKPLTISKPSCVRRAGRKQCVVVRAQGSSEDLLTAWDAKAKTLHATMLEKKKTLEAQRKAKVDKIMEELKVIAQDEKTFVTTKQDWKSSPPSFSVDVKIDADVIVD